MKNLLRTVAFAAGGAVAFSALTKSLLRQQRWFEWSDKVVLVTGGSRGLGLVLARELLARGAKVAICARTQSDLDDAAAELTALSGDCLAVTCDVRQEDQVNAMVEQVVRLFGRIDVLINNAGIIDIGPWESMSVDDFEDSMATNCWGALRTTLAIAPHMKRQGWGRILNVASLGGLRAVPHMLPYDVSKFAMVGLSTGFRTELAKDNILVTTVCPGLMRTGSPRNATFKAQHRKEFAWFSIGDAMPLLSISAEAAAEKILRACQNGDAQANIVGLLNISGLASRLAPNFAIEALAIVNRILPSMGGIGKKSAKGYESESAWSPSVLTTLGNDAAIRNNEL